MKSQHSTARLARVALVGVLLVAGVNCAGPASLSSDDGGQSDDASGYGSTASATITASTTTSTSCALPSGTTRTTSSGTICGPHPTTTSLTSDCCDWSTASCYPPNSADLACGTSTS